MLGKLSTLDGEVGISIISNPLVGKNMLEGITARRRGASGPWHRRFQNSFEWGLLKAWTWRGSMLWGKQQNWAGFPSVSFPDHIPPTLPAVLLAMTESSWVLAQVHSVREGQHHQLFCLQDLPMAWLHFSNWAAIWASPSPVHPAGSPFPSDTMSNTTVSTLTTQ